MKKLFNFLTILSLISLMVVPIKAESIVENEMNNYELCEEKEIYLDDELFVLEVWEEKNDASLTLASSFEETDSFTNSYVYALRTPVSNGSFVDSTEGNYLSYAVKIKVSLTYTKYSDSSNSYITYYKITNYTFDVLELETPCKMSSTTLTIENNGATASSGGVSNQIKSVDIGSATSGSLAGNSSWEPVYKIDDLYIRAYFQATIKRGSGMYTVTDTKNLN